MREYLTVTMKSGRKHEIILHMDESFKELAEKILYSENYFVSGDIILNVSEIESIEKGE